MWRSIPDWASCLIEFGYAWLDQPRESRKIAVISMPSDSAAAGLVTLGLMRRCLELDDANDTSLHYERLLALAQTRLGDVTLRHNVWNGVFVFDELDQNGVLWVSKLNANDNFRSTITRRSAVRWRVHGEGPVALLTGQEVPHAHLYTHLVHHGGAIKPENLSESYSKVCLAGRGTGENPTRAMMASVRFRHNGMEANLCELLTVQGWLPGTISRTLFYNTRNRQFDRKVGQPQIVIADGDASFLHVVDRTYFEPSDVIGVIHRTVERDRLEAIGNKLESKRQWYDQLVVDGPPTLARGIGIYMLKKR